MPSIAMVAAGLVTAGCLWLRWREGGAAWPLVDVEVFWRAAESLRAGKSLYTSPPGALPFTYPPFAAVVFFPLGFAGAKGAVWAISSAAVLSYATAVGVSALRTRVRLGIALLVGAGGLTLEPIVRNFVLGQVNLILMAMVLVDAFVVPSRFRGVLTGVAGGTKLTPAVFALWFIIRRDWGSLIRCSGAFIASVLVGFLFAGEDSWHYWKSFLGLGRFGYDAVTPMNQSLRALLVRATGLASPPSYWLAPAMLLCVVLCIIAAIVQMRAADDFASLLCISAGSLLLSPVSWTHHWVWVVPALLLVIGRGWTTGAWLAAALLFIAPMWFVPTGQGKDLILNTWQVVLSGCYVLLAVLFLIVMCLPSRGRKLVGKRQLRSMPGSDGMVIRALPRERETRSAILVPKEPSEGGFKTPRRRLPSAGGFRSRSPVRFGPAILRVTAFLFLGCLAHWITGHILSKRRGRLPSAPIRTP